MDDCGIYKITNKINGKVYIGKSIHIYKRWSEHKADINDLNKQNHLYRAFRMYGINNFIFEIIEQCIPDNKLLTQREQYWINFYNSYKTGYNETLGGEGQFKYNPTEIKFLWDQGLSVEQICNQLQCEKQTVYDNLNSYVINFTKESQQRSEAGRIEKLHQQGVQRCAYPVYQYDINGNYIAEYTDMTTAAKSLGKDKDNAIHKIFNDKTGKRKLAYGFQWSKIKVDKMPPYQSDYRISIRNINTGLIFISITAASKWGKTSWKTIKKALNNPTCSAGIHPETGEKLYWERLI